MALNCPLKPHRSMSTDEICSETEVQSVKKQCWSEKILTLLLPWCATPRKIAALCPAAGERIFYMVKHAILHPSTFAHAWRWGLCVLQR